MLKHTCFHFNVFFFFNDTATAGLYTLSLHDALPIFVAFPILMWRGSHPLVPLRMFRIRAFATKIGRHTSELQSRLHLVCRLLLEKKKKQQKSMIARKIPKIIT